MKHFIFRQRFGAFSLQELGGNFNGGRQCVCPLQEVDVTGERNASCNVPAPGIYQGAPAVETRLLSRPLNTNLPAGPVHRADGLRLLQRPPS